MPPRSRTRQTIIVCLASPFLGLAAFSGTASTGCSSSSGSSSGFSGSSSGGSGSSSDGSSSGSSTSSSGGSTGSGSSSSGGTSSGAHDASTIPPVNEAGIPLCGSTACDLKSNTCCLSQTFQTMCNPHSPSACPADWVAFNCLTKSDCTTAGQVCCGSANSNTMVASTQCQALGSNGLCGTTTPTAGYAQICEYTSECGGGLKCIAQTCAISSAVPPAHLSMCGLQSSAPFNCTAD